jgi:hypothetical protein
MIACAPSHASRAALFAHPSHEPCPRAGGPKAKARWWRWVAEFFRKGTTRRQFDLASEVLTLGTLPYNHLATPPWWEHVPRRLLLKL